MFNRLATKANKSPEPPSTHTGTPPDSEGAKQPLLPEPPYKPYTEKPPALYDLPYEPYKGI